ncbi:hypothetical protein COP1_040366 [Malus domestica]
MAYRMHIDEERCLLFPSTLSSGALNWYCRLPLEKPDESLRKYASHFSHKYSRYVEADDKTAFKAFTTCLRDCFFKYMINANTWKTYSEVMAHAYNHASVKARTYQGKPSTATPYQQGKKKDFHHHQSHFTKKTKGHYRDNQGYRHDNARPQVVNTVGQARVKTGPTPRYETYTPLNVTCVAIYPNIAHLIPKPKLRQLDYKSMKNTGTFTATTSIIAMTAKNISPFVIILKLWHVKEKLINSSFTLQGITVTNTK